MLLTSSEKGRFMKVHVFLCGRNFKKEALFVVSDANLDLFESFSLKSGLDWFYQWNIDEPPSVLERDLGLAEKRYPHYDFNSRSIVKILRDFPVVPSLNHVM